METNSDFNVEIVEALRVLGSFDPGTMLINLNNAASNGSIELDRKQSLNRSQLHVTAHEFSHFMQTTTTATGLRLFALWMDSLDTNLRFIKEAARVNHGKIIAPVLANQSFYSPLSKEYELLRNYYIEIQSKRLYHFGGWYVPLRLARRAQIIAPDILYRSTNYSILGQKRSWPLILLNLHEINGRSRAVALGARHLREGSAKAIDMVQVRLTGESGIRAINASDGPLSGPPTPERRRLADPYFLCNWLYADLAAHTPGCGEQASLEEFVAISDLAMMMDVLTMNWKEIRALSEDKRSVAMANLDQVDVNPAECYIALLQVFIDSWQQLSRFRPNYTQKDITKFQNQLLRLSGFNISLEEIISNCESFMEDAFDVWQQHSAVPSDLLTTYSDTFKRMLSWRRDVLKGGAVIIDLLTSAEELNDFFLSVVPAFLVGNLMYSGTLSSVPGLGIGIQMANLQQMHDVTEALISGNTSCRNHLEIPRACAVSPSQLCDSVLLEIGVEPRCARAQTLARIAESLKILEIKWR